MTTHHTPAAPSALSTLDTTRIDDTRIKAVRPLVTPALLQEWLPAPDAAQALVESSRAAISRVLHGQDDRLIVVVGPCSIHDHDQCSDDALQLQGQSQALKTELRIAVPVSVEKQSNVVGGEVYSNYPGMEDGFGIYEG